MVLAILASDILVWLSREACPFIPARIGIDAAAQSLAPGSAWGHLEWGHMDTSLLTAKWHSPWALASASTRIKYCAAAAADLQQPLQGVQGGEQK